VRSNLKLSPFFRQETNMLHRQKSLFLLAFSLFLFACSNNRKVTSGEQQFADAKNNLKSSDFKAALDNLNATIKVTTNEAVRQEALILRVALVTALADADEQMAEAYKTGAKAPLAHAQTAAFYAQRSDYNNAARDNLMDAMQMVMDQRSKLSPTPVPVEVAFPGFTAGDPALDKIKSGLLISDNERVNAELQMDRNCLAQVLANLAGADKDLNKGRDIYAAGKVPVDSRVYLVVFSDTFLRIGNMFDVKGINDPDKLRTVNQVVRANLDVAEKLLAAKPDKDLETRVKKMEGDCDKCLKKLGA
jgi:hypothetical protein